MLKKFPSPPIGANKQTKHEREMAILRAHHERVLKDKALREATLISAGIFVRDANGTLVVAKPYDKVIISKNATV
ncbi:MAG: hypothetical protein ABW202_10080 [Duganella sp.]